MPIEAWIPVIFNTIKSGVEYALRRRRTLTADEKLQRREKLKPIFESELYRCRKEQLRQDVIIHDVKRLDEYPESKGTKGISPWFKAYFVDMYHGGIQVALGLHEMTFDDYYGGWRYIESIDADPTYETLFLIGRIPYEQISYVEIDGDEYYSYPHIFCHFDIRGAPYKDLSFCREKKSQYSIYFEEIATYEEVRMASFKAGILPFKSDIDDE